MQKNRLPILTVILLTLAWMLAGCASLQQASRDRALGLDQWRAVHVLSPGKSGLPLLERTVMERFAPDGANVLILEVNYGFEYQSHPELRASNALSKADIRHLRQICRKHSIELIPQFNCFGHQSWAKNTYPLLIQYPELDETPEIPLDNPDIYCRSWCPLNPKTNEIVFELMDELIDAFQPKAFHVGMDEVFLIAHEQCSRCRGKDPADIFAKAINDYHRHLTGKHNLTMMLWGDRLLSAKQSGYSEWEASDNGTDSAIDKIPKDILICDWHYGMRDEYPSVPYFQEKGFRVLPSSWKDVDNALAFMRYSHKHRSPRMLGHMITTWLPGHSLYQALLGEEPESEKELTAQMTTAYYACVKEWVKPKK